MPAVNESQDSSELVWLCEGFQADQVPEILAVRQRIGTEERACFVRGNPDMVGDYLNEAVGAPEDVTVRIIDRIDNMDLVESAADGRTRVKNGRWTFEGVFQRAGGPDAKNVNQRFYPRAIWDDLVANENSYLQQRVREGKAIGINEHPADGRTKLNEWSIVTRKLTLKNDGVVWGRGSILDTPGGRILEAASADNLPWGVSSRARGKVADNGEVLKSHYLCKTWDAVSEPSTLGAFPSVTPPGKVNESDSQMNDPLEAVLPPQVVNLLNEAVSVLDSRSSDINVTKRLFKVFNGLSSLEPEYAVHPRVYSVQRQIAEKISDLNESMIIRITSPAVDESATTTQTPTLPQQEPVVDETLVEEVETLRQVADDLRDELSESRSLLTKTERTLADLKRQKAEAEIALQESQEESQTLRRRYDLALSQVVEATEMDVVDPLTEARTAALTQHPELAEYSSVLDPIDTVDELNEAVSKLVPLIGKRTVTASSVQRRHRLADINEVASDAFESRPAPTPRGVKTGPQMAMAAISKTTTTKE